MPQLTEEQRRQFKEAFDMFDRSRNGYITEHDLRTVSSPDHARTHLLLCRIYYSAAAAAPACTVRAPYY